MGHVRSFGSFESPEGLPGLDRRIIVPNGCSKIILMLQNALQVIDGSHRTPEPAAWNATDIRDKGIQTETGLSFDDPDEVDSVLIEWLRVAREGAR